MSVDDTCRTIVGIVIVELLRSIQAPGVYNNVFYYVRLPVPAISFFFFLNHPAPPEISPLSLPDALPTPLRLADGPPARRAPLAGQAGRVDRPRRARRLAARHGGRLLDVRRAGHLREADGDHEGDPSQIGRAHV